MFKNGRNGKILQPVVEFYIQVHVKWKYGLLIEKD